MCIRDRRSRRRSRISSLTPGVVLVQGTQMNGAMVSQVGPGGCPPRPPTDPDVRDYRIRLLGTADSLRTTCALGLLSERVALRCRRGSMSPTSFPHSVPLSRQPLPSTGSLRARFPGFISTMGRSDSPPSVPVGSFPRPAVPSRAPCFAPAIGEALPMTDQGFGLPAPLPADSGWRRWGLPGSWRTFDRMPCFYDSGGPAVPGHSSIGDVAFPLHVQGRRPRKVISELSTQPTISLSTLHPFGYPRGARLASGWRPPLAGRDSYPQGPFERFPRLRCHL